MDLIIYASLDFLKTESGTCVFWDGVDYRVGYDDPLRAYMMLGQHLGFLIDRLIIYVNVEYIGDDVDSILGFHKDNGITIIPRQGKFTYLLYMS